MTPFASLAEERDHHLAEAARLDAEAVRLDALGDASTDTMTAAQAAFIARAEAAQARAIAAFAESRRA